MNNESGAVVVIGKANSSYQWVKWNTTPKSTVETPKLMPMSSGSQSKDCAANITAKETKSRTAPIPPRITPPPP